LLAKGTQPGRGGMERRLPRHAAAGRFACCRKKRGSDAAAAAARLPPLQMAAAVVVINAAARMAPAYQGHSAESAPARINQPINRTQQPPCTRR